MSERFNPEMLQLARELRGMTQSELAIRAHLTQGFVSMLENGTKEASSEKVDAIASALDFPSTFFYQPGNYTGLGLSLVYYRKKASAQVTHLRRLQAEISIRRLEVSRLLRGLDVTTRNTFYAMDIDEHDGKAEAIAQMVRTTWGVPLGPLKNLVSLIESAGGIVFKFPFGTTDIDAIRRARDLKKITSETYTALFRRLSQLGYRKSEPIPLPPEQPEMISQIVETYRARSGYSLSELAALSRCREEDFHLRYVRTEGLRLAN